MIRIGDLDLDAQRLAQVLDPPRLRTDLDHHPVGRTLHHQIVHRRRRGRERGKRVLVSRRVVVTGHGLELAQVDRENVSHVGSPW